MDVKQTAVSRAVAMLNAAGAKYKIIFEGQEFGELQVVTKPQRAKGAARHSYKEIYLDKLKAMEIGDVLSFEHRHPEGLRSAMSANAAQHFGPGSCMSTVTGNRVELLRVS